MAGKLDHEARVTIKTSKERGASARSIARTLGVTEGAVRYHLRRQAGRWTVARLERRLRIG